MCNVSATRADNVLRDLGNEFIYLVRSYVGMSMFGGLSGTRAYLTQPFPCRPTMTSVIQMTQLVTGASGSVVSYLSMIFWESTL
jgi:hypothetical protein